MPAVHAVDGAAGVHDGPSGRRARDGRERLVDRADADPHGPGPAAREREREVDGEGRPVDGAVEHPLQLVADGPVERQHEPGPACRHALDEGQRLRDAVEIMGAVALVRRDDDHTSRVADRRP